MKRLLRSIVPLLVVALSLSGCVIYLDHPKETVVRGKVIDESGDGLGGVSVILESNRNYLPTPGMARIQAGSAITKDDGTFEFTAKNRWPALIYAWGEENSIFGETIIEAGKAEEVIIVMMARDSFPHLNQNG